MLYSLQEMGSKLRPWILGGFGVVITCKFSVFD